VAGAFEACRLPVSVRGLGIEEKIEENQHPLNSPHRNIVLSVVNSNHSSYAVTNIRRLENDGDTALPAESMMATAE
jgi:hypothetical protein